MPRYIISRVVDHLYPQQLFFLLIAGCENMHVGLDSLDDQLSNKSQIADHEFLQLGTEVLWLLEGVAFNYLFEFVFENE
jgi:hypothetical protein